MFEKRTPNLAQTRSNSLKLNHKKSKEKIPNFVNDSDVYIEQQHKETQQFVVVVFQESARTLVVSVPQLLLQFRSPQFAR